MSGTIKAAQVSSWGSPPVYTAVAAPPTPLPESDVVQIRVLAAGAHQLVRSRAAGKHYTSGPLPHIVGVDGVGSTVAEGKLVYFITLRTGGGSFAEVVNVPKSYYVFDLPEGVQPEAVAATVNPAMSSWMALKTRVDMAQLPKSGWTALIVGATSASGIIAAVMARKHGATKVIGVARNAAKLAAVPHVDMQVVIADPVASTDFSQLGEVDVVLDYLYGPLATHLLSTLPRQRRPLQYVHIGGVTAPEIVLPGAALRSKNLTIRGAGPVTLTSISFCSSTVYMCPAQTTSLSYSTRLTLSIPIDVGEP
ncbi:hypothetical protein C8T65DRAFT_587997 [Cerioporus squamosus]|nr:hypothetical protein C8T65DRAFT_587997 [Cerioporus squamosus]